MKYILCGNGNFINYVKAEMDSNSIEYGLFDDADLISPCEKSDVIAILAVSWHEVEKWVGRLHHQGYSTIFRVPIFNMQYKLPLFKEGKLNEDMLINVSAEERELLYVETHIADRCNLKCKGCMHFSNLVEEDVFPELEVIKRDFARVKELFGNVYIIRLMGGEPLLNPNLGEYVEVVREIFPASEIRIVTNGLLIPKQNEKLWKVIRKNYVAVDVSPYPPTIKMIDQIKAVLDKNGIPYGTISGELERFRKSLTLSPDNDPEKAVKLCQSSHCHFIRDGKIAKCPLPIMIEDFNREYGTNIVSNDVFDLYEEQSGLELKRKLDGYADMCKYCPSEPSFIDWEPTVNNAKISDWV